MKNWFIKIFEKSTGECYHDYGESFDFFGLGWRKPDGSFVPSYSPKKLRKCKKCGHIDVIRSYQR